MENCSEGRFYFNSGKNGSWLKDLPLNFNKKWNPTMTSFNLFLAKGENRLGYIFDIIVRNRCKLNAWSSDISKLYNQLYLDISALPYS